MVLAHQVRAQEDSLSIAAPYLLTVEDDILNLEVQNNKVYTTYAVGQTESGLLEAPLAAYVITADEIKQSGALTWGEALRLAPSLLVRQKTNGYFDVAIRGISGTIEGAASENTTVLLTINGIPYNEGRQGTITWETLPVGLQDVEQIEIVSTAHSAVFGANATSGVINIVTKQVEERSLRANVGLQGNLNENYVHQGSTSFGVSDQLKFSVSGRYQRLTRFQDEVYVLGEQRYVQSDSLLHYQSTARETNIFGEKSLRSAGINAIAHYQPNKKISVATMVSAKESYLQSIISPLSTIALTNRDTKNSAVAVQSKLGNFSTRLAYQSYRYKFAVGYPGTEVHNENLFASAGYHYAGKVYRITLSGDINRSAFTNELDRRASSFVTTAPYAREVLLGDTRQYHAGGFVSQQLRLLEGKWRWVATIRGDYFNLTSQLYESYQLGTTYRIGKSHWLRAATAYGLGNVTAQRYLNYSSEAQDYVTNQTLQPLRNRTYEVGYRTVPYSDLQLGITGFYSRLTNLTALDDITVTTRTNSDSSVAHYGLTADARWTVGKLQTSAFVTLQRTGKKAAEVATMDPSVPHYYGGMTGSYRAFLNKLRINGGVYYYGKSTAWRLEQNYAMPAKLLINCKISYNLWDQHTVFFNGRNILNNRTVEVPMAGQAGRLLLIGVDLVF